MSPYQRKCGRADHGAVGQNGRKQIKLPACLQIPPISKLHHQGPILYNERKGYIIIRINQEQIGGRLKTPLKSVIDIQVIDLFIVLGKGREENLIGQSDIQPRAYQPEGSMSPLLGKLKVIVSGGQRKTYIRLEPVAYFTCKISHASI